MKRKNRPMALGLFIATVAILIASLFSPSSNAVIADGNRSSSVECQKVTQNIHWDKRHKYDAHPLVTALGIGILVDTKGNAYTDNGKDVVILNDGDSLDHVIEGKGAVYLITK